MEVREAVRTAKNYLKEVFADEEIMNVGLEEVDFSGSAWEITLGFSRPWSQADQMVSALANRPPERSYKVIRIINSTGQVASLKDRILEAS